MKAPDAIALLRIWEQGAAKPAAVRALMLVAAASPECEDAALAQWNIGRRDSVLLHLRDALFGSTIQCLTTCTCCGEAIELEFRSDDIRVPHGEPCRAYRTVAAGYQVQFRLPDSSDLLALADDTPAQEGHAHHVPAQAERKLLARCVMDARTKRRAVPAMTLPDEVLAAVSQGMSEADPQADVLLEVSCPTCSSLSPAPFDIVSHLWAELDAWARRMLREVHALAVAYGWSEAEILSMGATRRRAYLDLIGT